MGIRPFRQSVIHFRYNYTGGTLDFMVRVPLTAEEIKRGQELGAVLRAARGARTMVDVALCAGVSVETLRKIETGRSPSPEFFTVLRICAELDLSMDGFLPSRGETASQAFLAS